MVAIIKKGASKEAIRKELERAKRGKGLNAKKYLGVIKLKEDPVDAQKRMRNEWD